ncbi:unnamed protein product [Amoebophrya sp. A25]|nr:unnamed protein product [Amoebophrya sp. A25]|eukprot:GSA25T00011399001.1
MVSTSRKIPVFLVTGQTGSGKSALIAHLIRALPKQTKALLIRHRHAKSAMLESFPAPEEYTAATTQTTELQETNVLYHVAHFSEVYDFGSGCACCAPDGDLMRQLSEVAGEFSRSELASNNHAELDHFVLFMETTGLADPKPFLRVFCSEHVITSHFELWGVLCVVDALRWQQTLKKESRTTVLDDTPAKKMMNFDVPCDSSTSPSDSSSLPARGMDQLAVADLVIVNHFEQKGTTSAFSDLLQWFANKCKSAKFSRNGDEVDQGRVVKWAAKTRLTVDVSDLEAFLENSGSCDEVVDSNAKDNEDAGRRAHFAPADDNNPSVLHLRNWRAANNRSTVSSGACKDCGLFHCADVKCFSSQLFSGSIFTPQLFKINRAEHDRTFQTGCVFGDDSTVLDFDRHVALLLALLSEGDLFRVQGWLSFLVDDSESASAAGFGATSALKNGHEPEMTLTSTKLLPLLLPATVFVDAVGPYPGRLEMAPLVELHAGKSRGLHGGAWESASETQMVCTNTKLFFCGRSSGSEEDLEREMRAVFSSFAPPKKQLHDDSPEAKDSKWIFHGLRAIFANEIETILRPLVASHLEETISRTRNDIGEARTTLGFTSDLGRAKDTAAKAATALQKTVAAEFAEACGTKPIRVLLRQSSTTRTDLIYNAEQDCLRVVQVFEVRRNKGSHPLPNHLVDTTSKEQLSYPKQCVEKETSAHERMRKLSEIERELILNKHWLVRGSGLWLHVPVEETRF